MDIKTRKLLVLIGLIVGLLSFFYIAADAAMNYSDNARFCLNCHSMVEAYETYQQSNHKQFKCTDCHAPYQKFQKAFYKTKSGLRDLYVTTLGDIPQHIEATEESREIINANCIRCHQSTVEKVGMGQGRFCTDCHRDLVHNPGDLAAGVGL